MPASQIKILLMKFAKMCTHFVRTTCDHYLFSQCLSDQFKHKDSDISDCPPAKMFFNNVVAENLMADLLNV